MKVINLTQRQTEELWDIAKDNIVIGSDDVPFLCSSGISKLLHRYEEFRMKNDQNKESEHRGSVIFMAETIISGEKVTSHSIINEHGQVYLKHPRQKGHWIECVPSTISFSINR